MSQQNQSSQASLTGDAISKMFDDAMNGRGTARLSDLLQRFTQMLPPNELARLLGPRAADASVADILRRQDKTYASEFTRALDARAEQRRTASAKAQPHAAQHNTESDDPHAAPGLAGAISHAKTHEEKVHLIAEHFEHGGTVAQAARALGATKEQAAEVAKIEEKTRAEFEQKFAKEREQKIEELRRRGIDRARAEQMVKAEEEARIKTETAKRAHEQGCITAEQRQTITQSAELAARQAGALENDTLLREAAKNGGQQGAEARQEVSAAYRAVKSGVLTEEQAFVLEADAARKLNKESLQKLLEEDREFKAKTAAAAIKNDGSAAGRELAQIAVASGAMSIGVISDAKRDETKTVGAERKKTSDDDFDSAASNAKVAQVTDFKGKLASMKPAEPAAQKASMSMG